MAFEKSLKTTIKVKEIMSSPVITGSPGDSILSIAKKMNNGKVSSIVIMDHGDVVGIVTDGDIIRKVTGENLLPNNVKAIDVMSRPMLKIKAESTVMEAAKMMRKYNIKRLGVEYKKDLVGMISLSDIVEVIPEIMEIISEKTSILTSKGQRRRNFISGYCDNCGEWSDFLSEMDGKFICEECRGEGKT